MKKTFKIINEDVRGYACEFIYGLPFDDVHEVIIRPYKQNRTQSQNALMWLWLDIIGSELGYLKDEMHLVYKEMFLIDLLERSPHEKDAKIRESIKNLRIIYKAGLQQEALLVRDGIISEISTTGLYVSQFTEYLKLIEQHSIDNGISLPHPDDYNYTMGIKKGG